MSTTEQDLPARVNQTAQTPKTVTLDDEHLKQSVHNATCFRHETPYFIAPVAMICSKTEHFSRLNRAFRETDPGRHPRGSKSTQTQSKVSDADRGDGCDQDDQKHNHAWRRLYSRGHSSWPSSRSVSAHKPRSGALTGSVPAATSAIPTSTPFTRLSGLPQRVWQHLR